MAFIVPVMRKDYMLYSNTKKPIKNVRKTRSDSNPEHMKTVPVRPQRLSCSDDLTPSSKPTTSSSPPRNSRLQYRSRRISTLPSTPETPEDCSVSPSSRQVRFGTCEEIQYDELENDVCFEDDILPLPMIPNKPKSCLRERATYSVAIPEKQNTLDSILSSSPKRRMFVMRLLSLCSPKN